MGRNSKSKRGTRNNSDPTGLSPPEKTVATTPHTPNMNISHVILQANESICGAMSPQHLLPDVSYIQQTMPIQTQSEFRPPPPPTSQSTYPLQSTPVQEPHQNVINQAPAQPTIPQGMPPAQSIDINMALQSIITNMNIMNGRFEGLNNTNNMIQQKLLKLDILDEIYRNLKYVE